MLCLSCDLQEGGMDEREGDGAEALDLDHDMFVVADAAGVAGVAGERPGGHLDVLPYTEIGLAINLTLGGGVIAREEFEQVEFLGGNRLDCV